MKRSLVWVVFVLLSFFSVEAYSQAVGSISGSIVDSTGATVPDFGSHTKRVKRIFSLWVLITCLPDLLAAPQCMPTAAFT